jgi:uncharacterized protein (TIGR00730 family)
MTPTFSPLRSQIRPLFEGASARKPSLRKIVEQFPREYGVAVYCGTSSIPGDPDFNLARRTGKAIGQTFKDERKLFTVTGGGDRHTNMGAVAQGAMEAGSTALGIPIPFPGEVQPKEDYTAMAEHPNFPLRIYGEAGFEQTSAYSVSLPGGIGTAWEIIGKAQDLYYDHTPFPAQKQIVLVDHNGYFTGKNGLISFVQGMIDAGMLKQDFMKLLRVVKTPEEIPAALLDTSVPWTKPKAHGNYVVKQRKINYMG